MSVSINGTGGITFADASTQSTGGYTGFRNRIINGAMMIDQRNAGASVTPANTAYTLDRWQYWGQLASKFTIQQSSVAPAGFKTSLLATVIAPVTVSTSGYYFLSQAIEGFNTADLGFGAVGASTVTLSFWVRSSLTGTFGGSLENGATNRSYPFTYTINSANTWEQKTITVAGDTSGTWVGATNGVGLFVNFGLGLGTTYSGAAGAWASADYRSVTGATSVVGTNGATFYITGVQLEKGSVATPFEFRQYGTELALCQRYYQPIYGFIRGASSSAIGSTGFTKVAMRAAPTLAGTASQGTSLVLGAVTADTTGSWYVQATSAVNGIVEYSGTATAEL